MSNQKHIAIIGAGIVGISSAIWLQRLGHKVTLIDRHDPANRNHGAASFGNAGVLASAAIIPGNEAGLIWQLPKLLLDPNAPLFVKWRYLPKIFPWLLAHLKHANAAANKHRAQALTPIIGDSLNDHKALAKGTGAKKWIIPSDFFYLYSNRKNYEHSRHSWDLRRTNGFSWQEMDGEAFRQYDPAFGGAIGFAARLADHGYICDPGQYISTLANHVEQQGGNIIKSEVSDIAHENGQISGVIADGTKIDCDVALICAGAWSAPLAKKLGVNIPLETERGYHLELYGANLKPRAPVLVTSGQYALTPMDGRLRLGGIAELGGLNAPPSKAPFELLRNNIRKTMPELTWKEESQWMGHRPVIADSIPVIGQVKQVKNAYLGFGHDHVGLTGGPKTGKLLAEMISGQTPNIDMTPYSPARFL